VLIVLIVVWGLQRNMSEAGGQLGTKREVVVMEEEVIDVEVKVRRGEKDGWRRKRGEEREMVGSGGEARRERMGGGGWRNGDMAKEVVEVL
jgi:hypothetical protein